MSRLCRLEVRSSNQKWLQILGLLPTTSYREQPAAAKLAEGEELGSNLLHVGQRTLTNAFVVMAQSSAHPLPYYHLIGVG
jgi:hypothetical protein